MDYDPNNPLGDILSDDSDDSFFNDDKHKSSNKTKSHQIINIEAKKADLFGLGDKSPSKKAKESTPLTEDLKKSKDDWLGLIDDPPKLDIKSSHVADDFPKKKDVKIISLKETRASDKLDFLNDLGSSEKFEKPPPSNNESKEKFSLDDLLGKTPQTSSKPKETFSAPALKKETIQNVSSGYTPTVSTKPEKKIDFGKLGNSFNSKTQLKESEKSISSSDANKRQKNKDWLGLFGDENEDVLSENKKGTDQKFSDLLNLPTKQDKTSSAAEKTPKIEKPETPLKRNETDLNEYKQLQNDLTSLVDKTLPTINPSGNTFQNLSEDIDIEQQSATLCIKQQESHLMVALQLKAQEERLAAMQERQEETKRIQQEVVQGHREQLDRMLQGQMDHRIQLQQIIKQHQDRINNHIQTLLQPTIMTNKTKDISDGGIQFNNYEEKKQFSEREQLEQIIIILKENHEREIDLMETSYKRQLDLVNDTLSKLEDRFKEDNEKLSQFYMAKINKLEEENISLYEQYESKIKLINERNEKQKSQMEDKHAQDIEILQNQHHLIMENIKRSITQEHSTLSETKEYSQKLSEVLSEINKNNKMCMTLMQNMEDMTSTEINSQNKIFQRKEEQINRLFDNLESQRLLLESEAQEKKASMSMIEERLKQQIQMVEDEKIILQKKQSDLLFEKEKMKTELDNLKRQFEMEKEIFKKNVENAENSNEEMKRHIDERVKKLQLDSQNILNEKQKIIETKNECQALKIKLQEELNELENKKQTLKLDEDRINENEAKLLERSRELEILTISALAKRKNAEEKLIEASFVQHQYQEKMNKIQEHTLSLNLKEREIARDKIALSRERLSLYNQRTENENFVCQLCKNSMLSHKPTKNHLENDIKFFNNNLELPVGYDNLFEINTGKGDFNDNMLNNMMNGLQNMKGHDLKLNKDMDKNFGLGQVNNYGTDLDVLKLMKLGDYKPEYDDNISQIFQAKYS